MSGNGEPTSTPAPTPPPEPTPAIGGEKTVPQSEVNRIIEARVGETKRATEEAIAKQLGVPVEEAKRMIEAAKAADDKDKSEAQLAREKADREAADSTAEKTAAAKERHEASVERALVRSIKVPTDVKPEDEDEWIDKKVARLVRLVDVEVGADAAAIKAAVDALRKDEPLLFGSAESDTPGRSSAPNSDPKGSPPKKPQGEDAMTRGAERAKAAARPAGYKILEDQKT